jgi:hypothetical protein
MALADRLSVRENESQRPCGYFWEGVNRMFGMRRRLEEGWAPRPTNKIALPVIGITDHTAPNAHTPPAARGDGYA